MVCRNPSLRIRASWPLSRGLTRTSRVSDSDDTRPLRAPLQAASSAGAGRPQIQRSRRRSLAARALMPVGTILAPGLQGSLHRKSPRHWSNELCLRGALCKSAEQLRLTTDYGVGESRRLGRARKQSPPTYSVPALFFRVSSGASARACAAVYVDGCRACGQPRRRCRRLRSGRGRCVRARDLRAPSVLRAR